MELNYPNINVFNTPTGKDLVKEISSLSWNTPTTKQIEIDGISIATSTGLRRNRNEDRFAVSVVSPNAFTNFFLAVVCDGVGSTSDGDWAANIVIASLVEELLLCDTSKNLKDIVNDIVIKTDRKVSLSLEGRGLTTLSVLLCSYGSTNAVVANVGDSRVYQWESSNSLEQVTIDDTFENELKGAGLENPQLLDDRRLRGVLSQAIGETQRDSNSLKVNIIECNLNQKGFLLASDGAWKSDEQAFELISTNANTSLDLVRRTTAFTSWSGGIDNMSIIAIENLNFLLNPCNYNSQEFSKVTLWCHDLKLVHTFTLDYKKNQKKIENDKSRYPKNLKKNKDKKALKPTQLELDSDTSEGSNSNFSTELRISSK